MSSLLKELKPQNSDMDQWFILSDCLFYTISSLPQGHEIIITAPKNKYDQTAYGTITATALYALI